MKTDAEERTPTKEEALNAFAVALHPQYERVRASLSRLREAPPQVLIIEGGSVEDRFSVATWYAAGLNCPHDALSPCLDCPVCLQIGAGAFHDLFILDGREGSIKIESVRELRSIVGEPPRGNGKRVIILAEAQALGIEAANALLKILEEPRFKACFLLVTPQRERLLPTLVSRSWTVTLPWKPSLPSDGLAEWEHAMASFFRTGRGWFERTSNKGAVDASLARELVLILQKAQVVLLSGQELGDLGKSLARLSERDQMYVGDLLAKSQESLDIGVNPALVLDRLMVRIYAEIRRNSRM